MINSQLQPANIVSKPRHWFLTILFIFCNWPHKLFWLVSIDRAADQYISSLSFSVRSEEIGNSPLQLLGVPQLSGSAASDTDILYEYLKSQKMIELVGSEINLRQIYSKPKNDFVFSLDPNSSIENLIKYWNRMVKVYHDTRTGLISVRVHAFDAKDAQAIAFSIEKYSTLLLNELSQAAREDAVSPKTK